MRPLLLLMDELSGRLDPRFRRVLLAASTAGLTLFARSTVVAMQANDVLDSLAGLVLLLLFAAGAALACTGADRRS